MFERQYGTADTKKIFRIVQSQYSRMPAVTIWTPTTELRTKTWQPRTNRRSALQWCGL